TVIQTVQLVAPKVRFVFAATPRPLGLQASDSELLERIWRLAQANPDILLVTYGPLPESTYEGLFESFAEKGILTVLAAGNEPTRSSPFAGRPILDRMMVVSAVDQYGLPADFTQRDAKNFWAPGAEIPVLVRASPGSPDAAPPKVE